MRGRSVLDVLADESPSSPVLIQPPLPPGGEQSPSLLFDLSAPRPLDYAFHRSLFKMDDLSDLELVGLVSKVVSEVQNHLGVVDRNLADFIIAQRVASDAFETFQQKMGGIGGDSLSTSFLESIDRLVRMMHPSMKPKNTDARHAPDKQRNVEQSHVRAQAYVEAQAQSRAVQRGQTQVHDSINDVLAELEALQPKTNEKARGARKRGRSRSRSTGPSTQENRRLRVDPSDQDRPRRTTYDADLDQLITEDGQRRGRRGRDEDSHYRREDKVPVMNHIYDGHVTNVKGFGAFVNLNGVSGNLTGLVHVSRLPGGLNHPSDLVARGQQIKVKVISMDGTRIGLSMKDVDQDTGRDLAPRVNFASSANMEPLGRGGNEYIDAQIQTPNPATKHQRRMTSPERWEIRQLIAAGVAQASDFPGLEDHNVTPKADGTPGLEEDLDIEVRDEEPPFLIGQTSQSLELSPIRVVKAPDGSMNRAAVTGTVLAKERAELRQQRAAEATTEAAGNEGNKVSLSGRWEDSMTNSKQPGFTGETRSINPTTTKPDSISSPSLADQVKSQGSGKRTDMTMKQQRESLPIFPLRDRLIDAIREHQILVVVGETGSGKTTQLTQYLAEAGFANDGIIGCTQPRRVAAMSVAKRVAEEVGCVLGDEVGYSIRFEDCTSPATKIKFMTDGTLQREILLDPSLEKYAVIILDEAHERTIATDVLFALLKRTLRKRPDLRVISTSATLDAEKFLTYFNNAPIFNIPGRTFPVEILYSREPESDYLDAALTTVMEIHLTEPAGDILVFLTGQEEIDTACEVLSERINAIGSGVPELIILPMYSALPPEMQRRIFDPAPPGARKVILATNIAETSITIDNIYYVVDPGFVKQDAYDAKLGMDSLIVTPISQAQASQRAGRAGRTGPGKCFRLYTETAYQSEMLPSPIPAIQRQNVSTTILMLKAMSINDILRFDFMDPPPINTTLAALEELYALGALDDEGILTRLGRRIADFPLDSSLAKVLIVASDLGCSDEILSIIAMLNQPNIFHRPKDKKAQADQKKSQFHDPSGDHLTLLNIYNAWQQHAYSSAWCFENYILARAMQQARDVRAQLVGLMARYRLPVVSCGRDTDRVRRALCAGFFRNAARRETAQAGAGAAAAAGGYRTVVQGTQVCMHPSSALFVGKRAAEWVVYHELVLTAREYMHWVTVVEPQWLVEAAPTFFRLAGAGGEMSRRRREERVAPLSGPGGRPVGKDEWRLEARRRGGGRGGRGTWG